MNIKKLYISAFGKLENKTIELSEGLNVIYAPNESGKTTVASFIKYLLYGFPKERQTEKNPVTEKVKYTPWSGAVPSGSMTLENEGREIVIARKTKGASGSVAVNDNLTGTPIPMFKEPGEEFFDISLPTFESTAFFSQGSFTEMKMDELESRLKNMATGADEQVSYEAAQKKLKGLYNKIYTTRATSKGGALEIKKRDIEAQLSNLIMNTDMETDFSQIESGLSSTESELADANKKLSELTAAFEENKTKTLAQREFEKSHLRSQITDLENDYPNLTREDINKNTMLYYKYNAELASFEKEPEEPKKSRAFLIMLIAGIVLMLGGVAAYFLKYLPLIPAAALSGVGLILLIVSLIISGAGGKKYKSAMEKYTAEKERYTVAHSSISYIYSYLKSYGQEGDIPEAFDELNRILDSISDKKNELARLELASSVGFDRSEDVEKAKQKVESLKNKQTQLKINLAEAKAKYAKNESNKEAINKLKDSLSEINEELEDCKADAKIVGLALSALDVAHSEMARLFAPEVNRIAGENMQKLSGGSRGITMNEKGEVRVTENGEIHPLNYYSSGTVDASYIAVRLACLKIIYGDNIPPLVFDDTFCNMDEERTISMLRMLDGTGVQVLYFTCKNPTPYLNGVTYNQVNL